MNRDRGDFSEESLEAYQRLVAEAQGLDFAEGDTYDFARCMRPDGSFYGTRGKCKKGTEAGAKEDPDKVQGSVSKVRSQINRRLADKLKSQKREDGETKPAKFMSSDQNKKEAKEKAEHQHQFEIQELQRAASKGDKEAMKELIKLRSEGKIGKEPGFGPGNKARQETLETKRAMEGKDPVAGLRKQERERQAKQAADERAKNLADAKKEVQDIKNEIKNRGPHTKEERANLDRMLRQAESRAERFESGKMMTREQFQAGLKRMK